jgi:hypothetical protein
MGFSRDRRGRTQNECMHIQLIANTHNTRGERTVERGGKRNGRREVGLNLVRIGTNHRQI